MRRYPTGQFPSELLTSFEWAANAATQGAASLLGLVLVALTFVTDQATRSAEVLRRRQSFYAKAVAPLLDPIIDALSRSLSPTGTEAIIIHRSHEPDVHVTNWDATVAAVKLRWYAWQYIARSRPESSESYRALLSLIYKARMKRDPSPEELSRLDQELFAGGGYMLIEPDRFFEELYLVSEFILARAKNWLMTEEKDRSRLEALDFTLFESFLDEYFRILESHVRVVHKARRLRSWPGLGLIALLAWVFIGGVLFLAVARSMDIQTVWVWLFGMVTLLSFGLWLFAWSLNILFQ